MGKTIVLIMASGGEVGAGGQPGKWAHEQFPNKLLLPIDGEPLIARTARQVRRATGQDAVVLTHWTEVQEVVPLYFVPEYHGGYTDTFMGAREIWRFAARVTVLNGDVLWHPKALKFVLSSGDSPRLYGDSLGQVYAWAFYKRDTSEVVQAVKAEAKTKRGPSYSQVHFLRLLAKSSNLRRSEYFRVVPQTYTQDFDIAKDYLDWLKRSGLAQEGESEKQRMGCPDGQGD